MDWLAVERVFEQTASSPGREVDRLGITVKEVSQCLATAAKWRICCVMRNRSMPDPNRQVNVIGHEAICQCLAGRLNVTGVERQEERELPIVFEQVFAVGAPVEDVIGRAWFKWMGIGHAVTRCNSKPVNL